MRVIHDKTGCNFMKIGFDNNLYLKTQSEHIKERVNKFGGKLYLEFGGKLFDDYHASRVLPGFKPDSKISMLMQLKDQAEAIIVINANDIEKKKVRGDLGITYDLEVLRLIDSFRDRHIHIGGIVMTQYSNQPAAEVFQKKLESLDTRVYRHYPIKGYPTNIPLIVSDEGYGKNDYVKTTHPLVVVTAPGPGSGKMAVCLSQLYHEQQKGTSAGYAKFETFPIWNLPLKHPINIAYEAATADLNDNNMIDPFHLEAYGKTTINYNRDVEIFPVLNAILERISGKSPYKSPTDMGVNMAGNCIIDDNIVCEAAKKEIIRRYFHALLEQKQGDTVNNSVFKMELLMKQAGVSVDDRRVVTAVRERVKDLSVPVAAIELDDGTIVTGKASPLLGASSAMLLNALKMLGKIEDCVHLIAPEVINPIQTLKVDYFGNKNPRLHIDEMLIALSICTNTDHNAKRAFTQIPKLRGCEVHTSAILSSVDEIVLRKLGVNLTCEPKYQTNCLFQG